MMALDKTGSSKEVSVFEGAAGKLVTRLDGPKRKGEGA